MLPVQKAHVLTHQVHNVLRRTNGRFADPRSRRPPAKFKTGNDPARLCRTDPGDHAQIDCPGAAKRCKGTVAGLKASSGATVVRQQSLGQTQGAAPLGIARSQ